MLGVVDTFQLEVARLSKDIDTLLNNQTNSPEAVEFSAILLESILSRVTTLSFCISKMYESSDKVKAGEIEGKDIVTGFVKNSLSRLILELLLSNNRSIGVSIPVVDKLNSDNGLNAEFNKLFELVKKIG